MKNKKIFIILILLLGIGFAYLSTTLNISGIGNIRGNKWDIHFENISISDGSVNATTEPYTDNATTTELDFEVRLNRPGDYYEFTVDIANRGTIDAMVDVVPTIEGISPSVSNLIKTDIYYTYNNSPMEINDLLEKNTLETITVRLYYNKDIEEEDLLDEDIPVDFSISIQYVKANSEANSVDYTDLEGLVKKIKTVGLTEDDIGYTVNVDIETLGEYELRVANVSTPSECSNANFSQTACGVVLEFTETISAYHMNPAGEYKGIQYANGWNKDGWPATEMRTILNNDLYNALPEVLKNNIIDTYAISSCGLNDVNGTGPDGNWESIDKIYLLEAGEIWFNEYTEDTAKLYLRQLDYYAKYNTTPTNYSAAKKLYDGVETAWWLRSAHIRFDNYFGHAGIGGEAQANTASRIIGISPAFRIG